MSSRSRGGCAACLQQHKKCDESRPVCHRCARLAIPCDYNPRLRWFNGARLHRCPRRSPRRRPQEASGVTDPSISDDGDAGPSAGQRPTVAPESPPPEELPHTPTRGRELEVGLVRPSTIESRPFLEFNHGNLAEDGQNLSEFASDMTLAGSNINQLWINYSADESVHLNLHSVFDGDLCSALLPQKSEQAAYIYFVHCVSLILPGHSDHRNGYRQLAAFSLQSPMLLDTIISIATTYMHRRHMAPRSVALTTQSRALASLRRSVDWLASPNDSTPSPAETACLKREVLATILLQITVEICNGSSVVKSHIAYAASLFRELGYEDHVPATPIGLILTHRMAFVDVLSSVFWRRRPLLSPGFWFLERDDEYRMADLTPRFQDTTGCPFWVVRVLARISHLVADVDDGLSSGDKATRALALESDLAAAAREHNMGSPTPSSHVEIVGRCYYWSAVILLQRRIFLDARESPRVQMSLLALLNLLATLPIGCGPDSALSLPLYMAALAAVGEDHRALIRDKSQSLDAYYPSQTRTVLTEAFGYMWAAADAELDSDLMRQRSLFIC